MYTVSLTLESSVDSVVYVWLAPGFAYCLLSIQLPHRRKYCYPGCFLRSVAVYSSSPGLELKKKLYIYPFLQF